jgi:AraC-like DNA-binding protein
MRTNSTFGVPTPPVLPEPDPGSGIDRLSALFEHFRVRARWIQSGPSCGVLDFPANADSGYLHVLRAGRLTVRHRDGPRAERTIELAEPSLLFYPGPRFHQFHLGDADGVRLTCAALAFPAGGRHPLLSALPPLLRLPLAGLGALEHTLALLFAETERVRCGQRLLADRLFEVLLLQLLRWLLDQPAPRAPNAGLLAGLADPRLARALTAVHEAPGEPWTLDALARHAGMSRTAFAQRFREQVGVTPVRYLADWRLGLAQAELRAGRPLSLVAQKLGYGTPGSLSRLFRRSFGQSPRDWLRGERGDSGGLGFTGPRA